jgi:hypothetical protein
MMALEASNEMREVKRMNPTSEERKKERKK